MSDASVSTLSGSLKTLVFASDERTAKDWIRCSGADPASCVLVTRPRQLSPVGVYKWHSTRWEDTEFYDAAEFGEIVEVGLSRWWTWGDAIEGFQDLKQEVERERNLTNR